MSDRRIYAKIDLDRIAANVEASFAGVPEGVRRCAVIKSNAYGHGAVAVAKRLQRSIDFFAVATAEEALELREAGIFRPVLILGYVWPEDYKELIEEEVRIPIYREEDAEAVSSAAIMAGMKALVHIKVDTGMNRIGFQLGDEDVDAVRRIRQLPGIQTEGIFTHFCRADEADKSYTAEQYEAFADFIRRVEDGAAPIPIHHCGNSAAILEMKDTHMDMMRLGIAMYGLYPSDEVSRDTQLLPAMELKSHIVHIKNVAKGAGIGYNHTAKLSSDRIIATVPVGYADGLPRLLSNKGSVLIRGCRAPIVGNICMDQFMVDVTDIPGAAFGDEVTLAGRDGDEEITMDEVAALCGTISYELICSVGRRVPRVY